MNFPRKKKRNSAGSTCMPDWPRGSTLVSQRGIDTEIAVGKVQWCAADDHHVIDCSAAEQNTNNSRRETRIETGKGPVPLRSFSSLDALLRVLCSQRQRTVAGFGPPQRWVIARYPSL